MGTNRAVKAFEASLDLFEDESVKISQEVHNSQASIEERGAIFTREEVVEFILDLVGYTPDKPLFSYSILEPSIGNGDFLLVIVRRLINSINIDCSKDLVLLLGNSLIGVEVHHETLERTKEKVIELLMREGKMDLVLSRQLANTWIKHSDFLLYQPNRTFDFIVGNPPYVRQELIPEALLRHYKKKFRTIYDRADLYIPFIEHSLNLLSNDGQLGFICADRWTKNKYGGPLRNYISSKFHLRYYIDMTDTDAFHSQVIAYPAITVFSRGNGDVTRVAYRPKVDRRDLKALATKLLAGIGSDSEVKEVRLEQDGSAPWILDFHSGLDLLRKLEERFPLIEETGCKIGIGVATGADKAFIGLFQELEVEQDRKLPLVMTRDILSGKIDWRGYGVVNPYNDDGSLVSLEDYPKLQRYLSGFREMIARRHVAKNNPGSWYKTIDRITPSLATREKLLIPDIKGVAQIVYDEGKFYPHHNLYYIVSEKWDLKILQAILLSGIATFFVSKYSPQMRGGYMRFQAQYLRRIRIPFYDSVSKDVLLRIKTALNNDNRDDCNEAIFDLYHLTPDERERIIKIK